MSRKLYFILMAFCIALSVSCGKDNTADIEILEQMYSNGVKEQEKANNPAPETKNVETTVSDKNNQMDVNDAPFYRDLTQLEEGIWINGDERYKEIVDVMGKAFVQAKEKNVMGSFCIATDDEVILIAGINATEQDGTIVDAYSTYEMGGTSLRITETAILQLIDRGELSMDQTIEEFFPDFKYAGEITISNLLNMETGIYDYCGEPAKFWGTVGATKEFTARFFSDEVTDEEFIDALNVCELKFEPGTKQAYSNTNYHMLALIIEKKTGQTFGEYCKENIFDKCGMENSAMQSEEIVSAKAQYPSEGKSTNILRGAGDLHTCVADMICFERALRACEFYSEETYIIHDEQINVFSGWFADYTNYLAINTSSFNNNWNHMYVEPYGHIYYYEMHTTNNDNYNTEQVIHKAYDELKAKLEKSDQVSE